jgi:DNA repair exonuclease SbcCD ATPase subunit
MPSGSKGRDLEEHLKNGLRAGTSSSGFGELLSDNKTVDPETYMIERLSDWVLTPSQGTYFTYEETNNETKNASDSRFGESANKQESVVKENTGMSTKLSKLEEKKFRRDMEAFLEAAQSIEDPQSRLAELEEILSYLDEGAAPDLKERVTEKVIAEKAFIENQLTEARRMKEELQVESVDGIKEKFNEASKAVEAIKKEATDWEAIATILQEKLDTLRVEMQERPTSSYTTYLKNKIKKMHNEKKEIVKHVESETAKIKEQVKKKNQRVAELLESVKDLESKLEKKDEVLSSLKEQISRLQARVTESEKEKALVENSFNEYKTLVESKPKLMSRPADAIAKFTNFRESDDLSAYWADLAIRHGKDILPYKERIMSSKTLRDAQTIYIKVLPLLNESLDVEAARIPESVSLTREDRRTLLEGAGVPIGEEKDSIDRLPDGWV